MTYHPVDKGTRLWQGVNGTPYRRPTSPQGPMTLQQIFIPSHRLRHETASRSRHMSTAVYFAAAARVRIGTQPGKSGWCSGHDRLGRVNACVWRSSWCCSRRRRCRRGRSSVSRNRLASDQPRKYVLRRRRTATVTIPRLFGSRRRRRRGLAFFLLQKTQTSATVSVTEMTLKKNFRNLQVKVTRVQIM